MVRGLLWFSLLATALAAGPAHARVADHNPVAFADASGDSRGAPDVIRVTVANNIPGSLAFLIQVADRGGILATDVVLISLDTDRNVETGDSGSDYQIRLDGTAQPKLYRWSGARFDEAAAPSLQGLWSNGYLIGISNADIGGSRAFRFAAITQLQQDPNGASDRVPDSAFHEYVIAMPHVAAAAVRFAPAAPRAGSTFRLSNVQLILDTEEVVSAATYACRATLAGKRLRGTGRGACTFRIAKTARGKRLVVTITASPRGGRSTTFRPQTFRVR